MARWTDLAEWRGPTPNQGPAMSEQRGLVIHIAEGYYEGTIAWQKNPSASVSSHFVLAGPRDVPKGGRDGKLAQVVDTAVAAWTQRDGNGHWLSVECSGFAPEDALSPAQVEGVARLFARCHTEYGVPLQIATSPSGRGLGPHSMGAESGANWGHSDCPGPKIIAQKPAILARAIEILNGDDMPTANEIAVAVWSASWNGPSGRETAAERLAQAARGTAAVAALVPKLNEILAAALDDGDTTVVLPPEAIAELQEISAAIAALPTAAENAEAVADELHERTTD